MYNTQAVKGGSDIRPVLFCGKVSLLQKEALEKMGYLVLTLPPFSRLATPVATHPDMLLFPLEGGFLLHQAYYEENADFFDALPVLLTKSDEIMERDYPHDVLFNALPLGTTVYGSKHISRYVKERFPHHVTVRQGYTRCSAALVGSGVITQDKTIFRALTENGVDALLISEGNIRLEGYDTGFIGGASLTLSPSLTAFFGKVEDHPDFESMKRFAARHGARLLSLSHEPLCDCGGGFILSYSQDTPKIIDHTISRKI